MNLSEKFSVEYVGSDAVITCPCFSAALSLDCGQAFRWSLKENGCWHGVVRGRALDLCEKDGKVILHGTGERDFEFWQAYFDLDRDYSALCEAFCADKSLAGAVEFCPGIRILRQEPWEAVCSFIISQNNNIPRIKGIIERLCVLLGEPLGGGDYAFPTAQAVERAGIEGLAPIRAGFRAKYIYDAARRIASGETDLKKIALLPLEEAQEELMKIKGVGPKVAQCVLLYGFGRTDAFPVDVWVRRILEELYPDGLPECTRGNEGIAQQYLFHWRRNALQP